MSGRLAARRAARRQERRERQADIAKALSQALRLEAVAMARSRAITKGEFAQSELALQRAREGKCSPKTIDHHFKVAVKLRALKPTGMRLVAAQPELSYRATYRAAIVSRALGAGPWGPLALIEAVRRLSGLIAWGRGR